MAKENLNKKDSIERFQTQIDYSDPFGSLVALLEKKNRNLEKRKFKAEQLRDLMESGQALNEDQKESAIRLKEIESTLEYVRDLISTLNKFRGGNGHAKSQLKPGMPGNVVVTGNGVIPGNGVIQAKDNLKTHLELQNNFKRLVENADNLIKINSNEDGILKPSEIDILIKFYDRIKITEKSMSTTQLKKIGTAYQKLMNREKVTVHPGSSNTYDELYLMCMKIVPSIESLKPAKVKQVPEAEPVVPKKEVEPVISESKVEVVENGSVSGGEWIELKKRTRNKPQATKGSQTMLPKNQTSPKAAQPTSDIKPAYNRKPGLNHTQDRRPYATVSKADHTVKTSIAEQEQIMNTLKARSKVIIKDLTVGRSQNVVNKKPSTVCVVDTNETWNDEFDLMD